MGFGNTHKNMNIRIAAFLLIIGKMLLNLRYINRKIFEQKYRFAKIKVLYGPGYYSKYLSLSLKKYFIYPLMAIRFLDYSSKIPL